MRRALPFVLLLFLVQPLVAVKACPPGNVTNIFMLYTKCHSFEHFHISGATPLSVEISMKPLKINGSLRISHTDYLERIDLKYIDVEGADVIIEYNKRLEYVGPFENLNKSKSVRIENNPMLNTSELVSSAKDTIQEPGTCHTVTADMACRTVKGEVRIDEQANFTWSHIREIRGKLILGDGSHGGSKYPQFTLLTSIKAGADGVAVHILKECPLSNLNILANVEIKGEVIIDDSLGVCHSPETREHEQLKHIDLQCNAARDKLFIILASVFGGLNAIFLVLIVIMIICRVCKGRNVSYVGKGSQAKAQTERQNQRVNTPKDQPKEVLDVAKKETRDRDDNNHKSGWDSPPKQREEELCKLPTAETGLFTGMDDMVVIEADAPSTKNVGKKNTEEQKDEKKQ